jgi:ATP-dependent DNA helicase RecG
VDKKKVKEVIKSGENISVEFKQSSKSLNKDIYKTVCSFLNRNSGHLFLGVKDDVEIIGVDKSLISQLK